VRVVPDFIIIGAQRCGTTSLYSYLVDHPCVASASVKEIHFFDINFHKGFVWYRSHFPLFLYPLYTQLRHRRSAISGEASPYYFFHPCASRRIKELLPRVKLIVLLRNPVDRAYSHYHFVVRLGYETLSFEEAIRAEEKRLCGEVDKMVEDEYYYSLNHQYYSYLARGIYVNQLAEWMGCFPSEQFLVLKSEDFLDDPALVLSCVTDFLGLPDWRPDVFVKYNHACYPMMDARTRSWLVDYFRPYNQELYSYLDRDFGWDS
jgi:hypothetical protein